MGGVCEDHVMGMKVGALSNDKTEAAFSYSSVI